MSDSASGSLTGFLYQFEKALAMLATLGHPQGAVSVEMVDDVAVHSPDDVVLIAVQAKHSISPNGTTFEDTSYALWRTVQLWIQKLASGTFNENTIFVCSTNKVIPPGALIRKNQRKRSNGCISRDYRPISCTGGKTKGVKRPKTRSRALYKKSE